MLVVIARWTDQPSSPVSWGGAQWHIVHVMDRRSANLSQTADLFEMPYRGILTDPNLSRDFASLEQKAIEEFVRDAAIEDPVRSEIRTIIEHGPPDLMLCRFVEEHQADLTVIGAYGRGLLFHLLIGGNAPRIVDWVPSDILLVRARREDPTSAERSASH